MNVTVTHRIVTEYDVTDGPIVIDLNDRPHRVHQVVVETTVEPDGEVVSSTELKGYRVKKDGTRVANPAWDLITVSYSDTEAIAAEIVKEFSR